jgi:putative tryptophan/tyrosine transport system substrate-binding protein
MRRREFIALLGNAAAWPLAARAQQSRIWRLGFLSPGLATDVVALGLYDTFKQKLLDLGYVEGQNLVLDVRRAGGDFSKLPGLAAQLVALRPDAIVASTTPAVSASQHATSTIPIVMGPTADPIGSGFIKSLAKPAGNITGVSIMSADLAPKSLEFLRALVPTAKRIAVLMTADPVHPTLLKPIEAAAQTTGFTIIPVTAQLPSDLESAFSTMSQEHCDGLIVLAAPINPTIPSLAARARLPTIYQVPEFAKLGGLLGYGPDIIEVMRQAAVFVDRIFKGANPADLPVEQPTKFDLFINLKAAKALDLTIPPTLLALADEVIE